MKLFLALCRRKNMPNGHIYRGKTRIVKEVQQEHVRQLRDQLEVEEKNMFLLRHPYLTPEQSRGHAKALGKPEINYVKTIRKVRPFFDNVTIESRLAHLRVNEGWD